MIGVTVERSSSWSSGFNCTGKKAGKRSALDDAYVAIGDALKLKEAQEGYSCLSKGLQNGRRTGGHVDQGSLSYGRML